VKAGYLVTVLEAQDRPGGRILTIRERFTDGLYVEDLRRYDRSSIAEFLRAQGASRGFIASLDGTDLASEVEAVSALSLLRDLNSISAESQLRGGGRIEGGTDRLPQAAAAKLGDRVVYGAEVKGIEQTREGVRVNFVRRGERAALDADRAIVTIPFSVLRHVEVSPPFSSSKRYAIERLAYHSVTRVFAQTRHRFWIERGESGTVNTDLPIRKIMEDSEYPQGKGGVLGTYVNGLESRRLTQMSEGERLSSVITQMEKAHPGLKEQLTAAVSLCWDTAPFARGAYAMFRPGEMSTLLPAIASPEGRIHFAGCHTSYRPGFMHGALASARRAVREIVGDHS
jgi:monoamine oxidase